MIRKGVPDSLCKNCKSRNGDVCAQHPNYDREIKVVRRHYNEKKVFYADVQECESHEERSEPIDDSCNLFESHKPQKEKKSKNFMNFVD